MTKTLKKAKHKEIDMVSEFSKVMSLLAILVMTCIQANTMKINQVKVFDITKYGAVSDPHKDTAKVKHSPYRPK